MAEEGLTEGDLLEFSRRCARKIDRFGIELEGRISEIEDRISTRMDECLALLHQRLRDRGLPIPPKRSLPPSRRESVSHSSSLAPRVISPNSLFQDQSTASSSMASPEPATTAYSSAVMEGDNQLPHQPIEALVDDDSNLKGEGQVLYQLFEPLRESKKLKQVVHKGDSPFLSDLYNVVDEQFENICEFKSAKILIKQVENDAKCEDEKKVEGSRLNVPNTFFTLDAYQQFDEMSEIVLDEVTAGGQLGTEMDVQVMELEMFKQRYVLFREVDGFMLRVGTFAFDPGGRIANKMEIQVLNWGGGNQNRMPAECDGFLLEFEHLGKLKLSCERGVEVNACNVFDEILEAAINIFIESEEIMPQLEPFVFIVLDPRGAYVWLNCGNGSGFLPRLPIHWDPGGCLFVIYVLLYLGLLVLLMIKGVGRHTQCDPCSYGLKAYVWLKAAYMGKV